MNIAAFILALLAIVVLIAPPVRGVSRFPVGIALAVAAWAIQLMWHTQHIVHF